jgi:hypothetical protein
MQSAESDARSGSRRKGKKLAPGHAAQDFQIVTAQNRRALLWLAITHNVFSSQVFNWQFQKWETAARDYLAVRISPLSALVRLRFSSRIDKQGHPSTLYRNSDTASE